MADVIISGCGNIGRRHLEALLACGRSVRVHVIEPDPESQAAAQEMASATPITASADAAKAPESADLAIIATGALVRRQAFEELLARATPRAVLFEKVLFTTRNDLVMVGNILRDRGIPAFVNCGRRGFADYDALRNKLKGQRGVSMTVDGAGWGLCSNAIHFIDLAEFLTGAQVQSLSSRGLDREPLPAKRAGCIELTGSLEGTLSNGGTLAIRCGADGIQPPTVTLTQGDAVWRVEESAGRMTHIPSGGTEQTTAFHTQRVSEMTHLYRELLDGHSRLTPYDESASQHGLMLDAFRLHLGKSISEDEPCPIS